MIKIGLAGWSYPDWNGVVYPRGCRDQLGFCADLVDCIEINSTFYRVPDPAHTRAWTGSLGRRSTRWTAKVPRLFTHQKLPDGEAFDQLVDQTRDGFAPLRLRLDALLLQFHHRFAHSAATLRHLARVVEAFADVAPLVVEVRHGSWQAPAALEALANLSVGLCHLDYPPPKNGFAMERTRIHARGGLAYFRAHGRNAKAFYDPEAGRDQAYDYLYSADQVDQMGDRLEAIASDSDHVIAIANNHYTGQAVKLSLELVAKLRDTRVDVPDGLLAAYPDLRKIARRAQGTLFD